MAPRRGQRAVDEQGQVDAVTEASGTLVPRSAEVSDALAYRLFRDFLEAIDDTERQRHLSPAPRPDAGSRRKRERRFPIAGTRSESD